MNYLKAYVASLGSTIQVMGIFYLLVRFCFTESLGAMYCVYVAFAMAMAGPLKLLLGDR